jgi:hypothetical protein
LSVYGNIWEILGVAPTRDAQELRRAYLRKLKVTNPEDDAESFKQLREAYEFASNIARYEADHEDEPPVAESNPEPAPADARPVDAAATVLNNALTTLASALYQRHDLDEEKALGLLDQILSPGNLERLDLLQTIDGQLAGLLAASLPRSDCLLAMASERLEWDLREQDGSLPPPASRVLERLKVLGYLDHLRAGNGEDSRAWARLTAPAYPPMRWLQAYVLNHSSWPELNLISHLETWHPEMLGDLNADNVAWWKRFESRPRLSAFTVSVCAALCVVIGVFAYSSGDGPVDPARAYRAFFHSALGMGVLALLRIYAIEWPIILVERRWNEGLPRWLAYGWIGELPTLLVLGLVTRGMPWMSWFIAGSAVLTALWATIAAGRVAPVFGPNGIEVKHSRLFRVALVNLLAGSWLIAVAASIGESFGMPLFVTIAAVLWASGVGRDLQIAWFETELSTRAQRACAFGALAVALILIVMVLGFGVGSREAWQVPLFVTVIGCTVLRRAAPFRIDYSRIGYQFGWLLLIIGFNAFRYGSELASGERSMSGEMSTDGLIIVGSLVFLAGMGFAAGRVLWAKDE